MLRGISEHGIIVLINYLSETVVASHQSSVRVAGIVGNDVLAVGEDLAAIATLLIVVVHALEEAANRVNYANYAIHDVFVALAAHAAALFLHVPVGEATIRPDVRKVVLFG